VVLVGHSASCQIVAHAASDTRVLGALLIGPTTDPRATSWAALASRWLGTARHEDPGMIPTLTRQYSHTGLPSMARAMEAARHHDITVGLEGLRKPVRVVRGPHDKIAPKDWTEHLATTTPFGSAETVGEGGHMIVITDGAAVAQEIRELIRMARASASP
jgi:pimeloyl-ACP methyl ester carboxylesterase